MDGVDEPLERAGELAPPLPDGGQFCLGLVAELLRPGALLLREGPGRCDALRQPVGGELDGCGDLRLTAQLLAAGGGLGAGRTLGLCRPGEALGPSGEGAGAFLDGAQCQPGVHLRRAGRAGAVTGVVAFGRVGLAELCLGGGQLEAGLQLAEAGDRLVAGRRCGLRRCGETSGLRLG